jgi:hypothetical protein
MTVTTEAPTTPPPAEVSTEQQADLLVESAPSVGSDAMPTDAPATPPARRSDEDLLALLEQDLARSGQRPSRRDVMGLTGVGNDRATRLLTALATRQGWPAPAKKRAGTSRAGTGGRSRSRTTKPAEPTPLAEHPREATSATDVPPTGISQTGTGPTVAVPPAPVPARGTRAGRSVAWVGFVFGSVTSVAANVLAARIPPIPAPAGWSPSLTAEFGAAVWPLALLLSVEVLSRVRMPSDWYWKLAKLGGAVAVAGGSAVISYGHIHDVLTTWRYSAAGAGVGPLVIDGLMVISGFALLAISRTRTGTAPGDAT